MAGKNIRNLIEGAETFDLPAEVRLFDWHARSGRSVLITAVLLGVLGVLIGVAFKVNVDVVQVWPRSRSDAGLFLFAAMTFTILIAFSVWRMHRALELRRQLVDWQRVMEKDTEKRERYLQAVSRISHAVGVYAEPQRIFDEITSTCVNLFSAQWVSLMIFDRETDSLVVKSAAGNSRSIVGLRTKIGRGASGWVAQNRRPLLLDCDFDASRYPGLELIDSSIRSSMVVPIVVGEELVGVINVSTRSEDVEYTGDDTRILEVFGQNAGACILHVRRAHSLLIAQGNG